MAPSSVVWVAGTSFVGVPVIWLFSIVRPSIAFPSMNLDVTFLNT